MVVAGGIAASRAVSGETLPKAGARLQSSERRDLAASKKDLEKIAAELRRDVSFDELSGK
jgi:hypothetical protein